jgi:hypothetical protein
MELTRDERIAYIEMDVDSLERFCAKMCRDFRRVKIFELDNPKSNDTTFIKELVNIIEQVEIPLEVFARDKEINPGYCVSKLEHAKDLLQYTINYFKKKIK